MRKAEAGQKSACSSRIEEKECCHKAGLDVNHRGGGAGAGGEPERAAPPAAGVPAGAGELRFRAKANSVGPKAGLPSWNPRSHKRGASHEATQEPEIRARENIA